MESKLNPADCSREEEGSMGERMSFATGGALALQDWEPNQAGFNT
jgi:hypothetical protein